MCNFSQSKAPVRNAFLQTNQGPIFRIFKAKTVFKQLVNIIIWARIFFKFDNGNNSYVCTVKSRLYKCRLSETTGLFEDYGQSWLFSLLFIAIKLPIIRISIIRKIQFFEVIHRSRLKKLLLNYPSRFEVQMTRMVIMISLFSRVWFTHLSD